MKKYSIFAIISLMLSVFNCNFSFAKFNHQIKSLKLYNIHTKEKIAIIFWQDGSYLPDALKKLNYFLRDWRNNKIHAISPKLLDLVWQIYRKSGSKNYIKVISAYRSPQSNNMLRLRSKNSGVASHSQHMLGHAMDIAIDGVKIANLRNIALKLHQGGVGYYPHSGIAFIHVDVGRVRQWCYTGVTRSKFLARARVKHS